MPSSCGTEILEIYAQQRFGTQFRYVYGTEILEIYALFMRNRDFWILCATGIFELIEICIRNRKSWNLCPLHAQQWSFAIYSQQGFGTHWDMYTEQKFLKSMRSSWGTEIFEFYAQHGLLKSLRYIYGTEILGRKAFLQGKNYQDQLNVIFQVVGPPSEKDLEVCIRWSLLWVCVEFFSCHFPDCWTPVWQGSGGMHSLVSFVGVCRVLFMSLSGLLGLRLKGSWDMRL